MGSNDKKIFPPWDLTEKTKKAMCKKTEIKDVCSYLQWVKKMQKQNPCGIFPGYPMYFRGQSSSSYDIAPSLFRTKNRGLVNKEYILLQKAKFTLGDKAIGQDSLNLLSTFQHYGLITRLLDVTTNPLIALFFACQETNEKEKNGIVYCGYPKEGNSIESANVIAYFSFVQDGDLPCEINAQSKKLGINSIEKILCNSYFFTPPISNERIIAQSGGFLIAPYLEKTNIKNHKITDFEYKQGEAEVFSEECAVVDENNKSDILEELSVYGFNEGVIFPDLTHKLTAVNKEILCKQKAIEEINIDYHSF